jgi:hypothetical protein
MAAQFIYMDDKVELVINNQTVLTYNDVIVDGKNVGISHGFQDDSLNPEQLSALLLLKLGQLPDFFNYKGVYEFKHRHFDIVIDYPDNVLHVSLEVDLPNWDYPFSFRKFSSFLQVIAKQDAIDIRVETDIYSMLSVLNSSPVHNGLNIKTQLEQAANNIIKYHEKAISTLLLKSNGNTFTKIFNFPDEYENICSQYLMWFGEFLKNLGIKANVRTEPNNGQTALIVSPNESDELLIKIEQLFYQYIQLPYVELLPPQNELTPNEMHAYQSALMQVQHLNTQIQLKDSIIASYQATNTSLQAQLQQQVNQPLLIDSLKDEKKYEFFNGALKIPAKQTLGKNGKIEIDISKIFSKT